MIPSGEIFFLLMILWLHNLNSVVEMDTLEKVSLFDQEQSHLRKITEITLKLKHNPYVISRDKFNDSEKIILTVPKSNVIRWSWISMFAQLDSVVNHDLLQLLVHVVGILKLVVRVQTSLLVYVLLVLMNPSLNNWLEF